MAAATTPAVFTREPLEALQTNVVGRVKYTCMDVSANLIVLGANTGSLYFCERESLRLVEMFALKVGEMPGAVTRVRISPTGRRVAFASQFCVAVAECSFSSPRDTVKLLFKFSAHKEGTEVTALEWDRSGERVFSGDDQGLVYMTQVPTMFGPAPQLLARAESRIVQLSVDPQQPLLVASDMTRCLLIEYLVTPTPKCTQIGRQLRNGLQGACFYTPKRDRLFAARPNLRLWAVSISGAKVEATIKFDVAAGEAEASRSLGRLFTFGDCVVSWGPDGVALLDVNVERPGIVEWVAGDLHDPLDAAVVTLTPQFSAVYVLTSAGRVVKLSCRVPEPKSQAAELKEVVAPAVPAIPTITAPAPAPVTNPATAPSTAIAASQEQLPGAPPAPIAPETPAPPPPSEPAPQSVEPAAPEVPSEPAPAAPESIPGVQPVPEAVTPEPAPDASITQTADSVAVETKVVPAVVEAPSVPTPEVVPEPIASAPGPVAEPVPPPVAKSVPEVPAAPMSEPPSTVVAPEKALTIVPTEQASSTEVASVVPPEPSKVQQEVADQAKSAIETDYPARQASTSPVPDQIDETGGRSSVSPPPVGPMTLASGKTIYAEAIAPIPMKRKKGGAGSSNRRKVAAVIEPQAQQAAPPLLEKQSAPQVIPPPLVQPAQPKEAAPAPAPAEPVVPQTAVAVSLPAISSEATASPRLQPSAPATSSPISITVSQQQQHDSLSPGATVAAALSAGRRHLQTSSTTGLSNLGSFLSSKITKINEFAAEIAAKQISLPQSSSLSQLMQTNQQVPQQPAAPVVSGSRVVDVIPGVPTEAKDLIADVATLTELTAKALYTYAESGGTVPGLRPWLDLWVQGAEANKQEFALPVNNTPVVQSVATACFELKVTPSGISSREWSEKDALWYINSLGTVLSLKRVSAACSEWHFADALKALIPLYEARASSLIAAAATTPRGSQPTSSPGEARLLDVAQALISGDYTNSLTLLRKCEDVGLFIWALPKLAKMPQSQPKQIALMLLDEHPTLRPWNVHIALEGTRVFVKYMNKTMKNMLKLRQDSEAVVLWFSGLIKDGAPANTLLFEADGKTPVAKSDLLEWQNSQRLMTILRSNNEFNTRGQGEVLSRLCREAGFWEGLLHVARALKNLEEIVRVAVDVDNWSVLEDTLRGCHCNHSVWCEAVTRVALRRGREHPQISMRRVIALLLECLGPIETCNIIEKSPGASECIPAQSYASILRVGRISLTQQASVARSLLSSYDSYLWSKRPWVVSPQLRSFTEIESTDPKSLSNLPFLKPSTGPAATTSFVTAFDPAIAAPSVSYEESANAHWGVSCDTTGNCMFCSLPLSENPTVGATSQAQTVMQSSTNIVVFPRCGHAFHQFCLGADACVLCMQANFTSLVAPKDN